MLLCCILLSLLCQEGLQLSLGLQILSCTRKENTRRECSCTKELHRVHNTTSSIHKVHSRCASRRALPVVLIAVHKPSRPVMSPCVGIATRAAERAAANDEEAHLQLFELLHKLQPLLLGCTGIRMHRKARTAVPSERPSTCSRSQDTIQACVMHPMRWPTIKACKNCQQCCGMVLYTALLLPFDRK